MKAGEKLWKLEDIFSTEEISEELEMKKKAWYEMEEDSGSTA